MKIKTKQTDWRTVSAMPLPAHVKPRRPGLFFRTLMRAASAPDLAAVHFSYTDSRPDAVKDVPCLILMNHASFTDLEIASAILYPKPYGIVCTADGLIGKEWLMRHLGCIPTQKFVSDLTLVRDIKYALTDRKMSVLMYPEASYSFDGTATALPDSLGGLLRLLEVPVVMITTYGSFARDPLYNGLRKRDVTVTADVRLLLDAETIKTMSSEDVNAVLREAFNFDYFAWQRDNRVSIPAPFRGEGLERILYKCPVCGVEGRTKGQGTGISCTACGAAWEMDEFGQLSSSAVSGGFAHVPDWYAWERESVRHELENGTYAVDVPVRIGVVQDYSAVYMIGEGRLTHNRDGFRLTGPDGLDYVRSPLASYSLYADYYWYELGDVIIIGDRDRQYVCFPPEDLPVAKTRLAAEELFKLARAEKRR